MSGTTGRHAFCEMTVFSSHYYRNDVLFYRQIFKNPISLAVFVQWSWNFAQRSRIIISFNSRKKKFEKIADVSRNKQFSIFANKCWRHQFFENFFLETEDIDKLNLRANFQIYWKNKSWVISNLILCWRQQKRF